MTLRSELKTVQDLMIGLVRSESNLFHQTMQLNVELDTPVTESPPEVGTLLQTALACITSVAQKDAADLAKSFMIRNMLDGCQTGTPAYRVEVVMRLLAEVFAQAAPLVAQTLAEHRGALIDACVKK